MKFESLELICGNENEVGAKYKLIVDENGRQLEFIETVTAYEFQKRVVFNLKDDFADFNLDISFKEQNGKTILTEVNRAGDGLPFWSKVMVTAFSRNYAVGKRIDYKPLRFTEF